MKAAILAFDGRAIAVDGDELRRVLMLLASGERPTKVRGMDMGTLYDPDTIDPATARGMVRNKLWTDVEA